MAQRSGETLSTAATAEDVRRVLGELDEASMLDILALRPNVEDLETASVQLSGDADVFEPGTLLQGVSAEIVEILTAGEGEEEQTRAH
jgi:hypothetical protein